jgi:hypothetical protein
MSNSGFSDKINDVEVLDQLKERVRAAHHKLQFSERLTLAAALEAGTALLAIQDRISGTMKGWMVKNFPKIGTSTWKLYLWLANHQAEIDAARELNPELSISEARRLISVKKPRRKNPALQPILTDAQLIAELTARGPAWFHENLPLLSGWRAWLQARLRGQILRTEQAKHPNVRMRHLRIVHSEPEPPTQH